MNTDTSSALPPLGPGYSFFGFLGVEEEEGGDGTAVPEGAEEVDVVPAGVAGAAGSPEEDEKEENMFFTDADSASLSKLYHFLPYKACLRIRKTLVSEYIELKGNIRAAIVTFQLSSSILLLYTHKHTYRCSRVIRIHVCMPCTNTFEVKGSVLLAASWRCRRSAVLVCLYPGSQLSRRRPVRIQKRGGY